jgi:predicted transcriptional regulator
MEDGRALSPRQVIERDVLAILEEAGVVPREFESRMRERRVVRARAMVARYLRARGWSYPRIGKFMGRDHSTVMSVIGKYVTTQETARLERQRNEWAAAAAMVTVNGSGEAGVREPVEGVCEPDTYGQGDHCMDVLP